MSDPIILPSPPEIQYTEVESEKIKRLHSRIRDIKTITEPLNTYVDFNRDISSDVQLIMTIDRWLILSLIIKGLMKSHLEGDFYDIKNPPKKLKDEMDQVSLEIDTITKDFIDGLKIMSNKLQVDIEDKYRKI